MKNSNSYRWREIASLDEVIVQSIGFDPIAASGRNVYAKYAEACERAAALAAEMQRIAEKFFHFSMDIPELLPVPTEAAKDGNELRMLMKAHIKLFADQLAEQWKHDRIGTLTVFDNGTCRFSYYEYETRKGGVLTRRTDLTRVEHDVINTRFHRLPAERIEKPQRAHDIIAELHLLKSFARIVTGTEVVRGTQKEETIEERTRAGRAVDRSGQFLKDHWKETAATAGLGILGALGTYAYMAAAAAAANAATAATIAAVAVADPALIVADRVLVGWE